MLSPYAHALTEKLGGMTTVRRWTGREAALLRAALRMSIRDFAAKLGVDSRTVTKWQARGAAVVLRPHMQAILDTALDQAAESAKVRFADMLQADGTHSAATSFGVYFNRRPPGRVRQVNRQAFLRTSGALMMLPFGELLAATTSPSWLPTRIGKVHVEQVDAAAGALCTLDNRYGGGLVRDAAFAQLRWSAQLLRGGPGPLRADLFRAVARLAQVAGFAAADIDAHEDSRRAFNFGLACAEQCGARHVRASLLGDMALQALWSGRPDHGLIHVDMALADSDRLTTTGRARLHSVRARVLAKLQRTEEALAAVGAGDEEFTGANPADEPPWMPPYDEIWHQALTGHALAEVAIVGRKTQAACRLTYTISQHRQGYGRLRAVSRTKYAALLMATGDPREAATIAHQALDELGELRSRRAVEDLRRLKRFAGRHPQITEATELRGRIEELLHAG